jgi:hypothetical protein
MTEIAQRLGVNKSAVSRHFRRHLEPAITAAGGSPALAWTVREKSREMAQRMELLVNSITRDSKTGSDITERELLVRWQAVRGLASEMREWLKLHGQASGELRETERSQTWALQIICPGIPIGAEQPRVMYTADSDFHVEEIGLINQ